MEGTSFVSYPVDNAQDFLDFLRLTNSVWQIDFNAWQHRWLFRGQGDASKPLIPSVWRTNSQSQMTRLVEHYARKRNYSEDIEYVRNWLPNFAEGKHQFTEVHFNNALHVCYRIQVELTLIDRLLKQALSRGIPVPDYMRIQDFLNPYLGFPLGILSRLVYGETDDIDSDLRALIRHNSFFALAQHHGIPTRLLDWTTSPYIAAFFAAESALNYQDLEGRLAVFAVHQDFLEAKKIYNFPFPKSDNPYLQAQRGELTLRFTGAVHIICGTENIPLLTRF